MQLLHQEEFLLELLQQLHYFMQQKH
jgi:hypothetical protein